MRTRIAWILPVLIGTVILAVEGCEARYPDRGQGTYEHGTSVSATSNRPHALKQSARASVRTPYRPPDSFEGIPLGTPFPEVSGIVRYESKSVRHAPGKALALSGRCDQWDSKTHQCKRFRVDQTLDGEGSYAFSTYSMRGPQSTPVAAPPVRGLVSLVFFCAHAVGDLPDDIARDLSLCGGQYAFRTDTLDQVQARDEHDRQQLAIVTQELGQTTRDEPAYARLQTLLQGVKDRLQYDSTPHEAMLDWLIAHYGHPDNFRPRGVIRIEWANGALASPRPLRSPYVLYRWCAVSPYALSPACPASITYSCDLGQSGSCTVIIATPIVYGFAQAEHDAGDCGYWLFRILHEDARELSHRTRRPSLCCTDAPECRPEGGRMSSRELSQFEPQGLP